MEENSWAGRPGSADDPRRLRMNITKTNIVADGNSFERRLFLRLGHYYLRQTITLSIKLLSLFTSYQPRNKLTVLVYISLMFAWWCMYNIIIILEYLNR